MKNFTWNVFRQTGSIDTYLLFKEIEKDFDNDPIADHEELEEVDIPVL